MVNQFETAAQEEGDFVLRAVVAALQQLADDNSVAMKVEPTTNFVQFEKDLGDSLFHFEMVMSIEEQLGIRLDDKEWAAFYRSPVCSAAVDRSQTWEEWEVDVVPTLTVGALANFFRKRYVPVSFEPVSVLGSPPCPAAGYFVGMSEIVGKIKPNAERFGPSTPINSVLPSRQLQTFWRRLSRSAGRSLPQLSFWLNRLANVLLIGSAACLLFGVFVDWAFLAAAWLLCLKGLLLARYLYRRANPLPEGIVTFGDLARHLAGQKEISESRTLSRRWGAWVGNTFLRRRSASSVECVQQRETHS